jgi:EmrB/QacA subfamily drug resistance transporter
MRVVRKGAVLELTAERSAWTQRQWGVLGTMCLAAIVIVMDGSIVNVALPTLARELHGASNSRLQWIVDAYILAFATLLMPAGGAADRFGRKKMLVLGLLTFAATSIGAAMAQSSLQLISWRAMMGLGAAMIFPSTLAIISDAFPDAKERSKAIAAWAGSSGLGVAIGPIAAGLLLEHGHWGWIFLVNLPLVLVAIVGVLWWVNESRDRSHARLDGVGSLLSALGVFGVVLGLIEAPEMGWTSTFTLVSLGLGVVMIGAFVWWERRTPSPVLDMSCFQDRSFSAACLALAVAFFGLFGFVFMVTQYFQFIQGCSALSAGMRTLPFAGFILLGAVIAAWHARVPNRGGWLGAASVMPVGLLLMAGGFLWASNDRVATPYAIMACQMGLLGTGLGIVNAFGTAAIMGALPLDKAGTGSSVNDTLREVGGTLGVAALGSAFNAVYRSRIASEVAGSPLPADAQDAVRSSVGAATEVITRVGGVAGEAAAQALQTVVHDSFLDGFQTSCLIAVGAAIVGAVCVFVLGLQAAANSAGINTQRVE